MKPIDLLEAVILVKRSHGEQHPAVFVKPQAQIRDNIIGFIGDSGGKVTREELKAFNDKLKEDGLPFSANLDCFLYYNKHLIRRSVANGEIYYNLKRAGNNFINFRKQ